MFRRLRNRLDHIEGDADHTMAIARDLLADFQDGFGVTVEIDEDATKKLIALLFKGQAGSLPLKIKIDPTIDS